MSEEAGQDAAGSPASQLRFRLLAVAIALIATVSLAALIILAQQSNAQRDAALARKQHSYDVVMLTSEVDGAMARSEASLGRFVIDGERETGQLYYDQWRRAGSAIDQLARLTHDNPAQVARLARLRALYLQRGAELAEPATRATYRQGWPALSLFARAGKSAVLPRIGRVLAEIAGAERELLDERSAAAADTVRRSNQLGVLLSAVGILLALSVIALGWLAGAALIENRVARDLAEVEGDRALWLERAVAERTGELADANESLQQEAATRAEAEARLRQVQKMDAVGQLTGGIAHDFNNMLAVVVGGLEMARRRLDEQTADTARHLDSAMDGANRAAALTRRLLSFARAEPLMPSAVDASALLDGMRDLIDRTIGERIEVRMAAMPGLWPIWVDRYQLENALLNLAVNARDAMRGAGTLTIAADNVVLAGDEIGSLPAGDYVRIAVTDDGAGMDAATLERVFEPFFTTKPAGQGTGLGLSQILGFTRQSGGEVAIASQLGQGATVAVHLPRHRGAVAADPIPTSPPTDGLARLTGTILLMEDDPRVRAATGDALAELGHDVVACGSAEEAMALLARRPIALIITDVIMPGMTGPEFVQAITPLYPGIGILFVTGYVGEAGGAENFAGHAVLRKPFTLGALATAVDAARRGLRTDARPRAA